MHFVVLFLSKVYNAWANFWANTQKSQNSHFNGLLLIKVYNVWTKKLQRSYVSWHWRVIQRKANSWEICIFLCCNRPEAVNGRYSWSVEKMFDNCLEWRLFLFLLTSIFWGYLNSQVSINKMGKSLDFHPCLSRLTPRIYHFMFL